MEETKALASEQGFVETVFGRRLYLPEINAKAVPRRQAAERTAINAPMQGTAADIIKLAMIACKITARRDLDAARRSCKCMMSWCLKWLKEMRRHSMTG